MGCLLQRGQRFRMGGRQWRVAYVTCSRAHCVSTVKVRVSLPGGRTFNASRHTAIDIAPTAAVGVLEELGL